MGLLLCPRPSTSPRIRFAAPPRSASLSARHAQKLSVCFRAGTLPAGKMNGEWVASKTKLREAYARLVSGGSAA
jgi:hypothetical protein